MKSSKPTTVRLTPDAKLRLRQLAKLRKVSQQTVIQSALQMELFPKKGAH